MDQKEREKLLKDVLSKRRTFNTIHDETKDVIANTTDQLNEIIANNVEQMNQLANDFDYSEQDLKNLQHDIEKDFNIKIETPKEVVRGLKTKDIFDEIETSLNEIVLGQNRAVNDVCIAFRRPYVTGNNPMKTRNTIIISGPNGTGRHLIVQSMLNELKKHGLTVSNEILKLDMARYQSNSQETLFLQDLYMVLKGKNPVILIENFDEGYPLYNRMINDLVTNGEVFLSKRYSLKNNQLQEASGNLQTDIIDSLLGNDKIIVFITTKKTSKLMDTYGKNFIDNVDDMIQTCILDDKSLKAILNNCLNELINKIKIQLEIQASVDETCIEWLLEQYEPNNGIDSITPLIRKLYEELVQVALEEDNIVTATFKYENNIKVIINNSKAIEIIIDNDVKAERDAIQKELDDIVGLNEVKNYLLSLEDHIKVTKLRKQKGLKTTEISKHMIFTGNPGTGKTTIARLVSRMMKACGVLKQGQLVEVTRADLVGKYVGHTAPLTMSVINSALGGVLFIDEAYSLYRGKDDSFGLEAIDTLVKAMEDHRDDLIVILAGYSKEMSEFLTANSGLKSRFANIINFEDYTGEELLKISISIAKSKEYIIDEQCYKPLQDYYTLKQMDDSQTSGNGRLARNVIEDAILKQSKRIMQDETASLELIKLEDFDLQ